MKCQSVKKFKMSKNKCCRIYKTKLTKFHNHNTEISPVITVELQTKIIITFNVA